MLSPTEQPGETVLWRTHPSSEMDDSATVLRGFRNRANTPLKTREPTAAENEIVLEKRLLTSGPTDAHNDLLPFGPTKLGDSFTVILVVYRQFVHVNVTRFRLHYSVMGVFRQQRTFPWNWVREERNATQTVPVSYRDL